ncbi:hypothetical protein [Vaginella massiliensis]|nr:hypothetical protein [Vaginella massiliensis]
MKIVLILLLSPVTLSRYAQSPKNVSPFKINQIKKNLKILRNYTTLPRVL